MQRMTASLAIVALSLVARPVLAAHDEPATARLIKGFLVTAYEPCLSQQTSTGGSLPACSGVVRSNPTCGFAGRGTGSFRVRATNGDVDFKATLRGLEAACQGRLLQLRATVRATLADCGGSPCTLVELVKVPLGTCTVDVTGSCTVSATMNSVRPNTIPAGKKMGIEVLDMDVFDATTNRPSFRAGLLVQ